MSPLRQQKMNRPLTREKATQREHRCIAAASVSTFTRHRDTPITLDFPNKGCSLVRLVIRTWPCFASRNGGIGGGEGQRSMRRSWESCQVGELGEENKASR